MPNDIANNMATTIQQLESRINAICEELGELFDYPCNFYPPEKIMIESGFCEGNCGDSIQPSECWKRYFEVKFQQKGNSIQRRIKMNLHEMAKEGAEIQARNEAEAFKNAISKAFKVNDEVEAAYRQGYAEGVKSEAARQLYDCIDTLVHEISKALTDCIKRAKIEVGFAKETEKLQEQHWNECRQIAHYDDELRRVKKLLKAAVEDLNATEACDICEYYPIINGDSCQKDDCFKWRYADEALALIEGGTDNA